MANSNIRVGVVGAGDNTRTRHIPGLREIEGVEVVAVCNSTRASSERVAADLNIPGVFDDWRALVESDDCDAVVIGTWPYLHCPVTLAALETGKHVMCEARMAMNATEARQMYEASLDHPDLVAQVVPSPFSLGVDATIVRLIADGAIGTPLVVEVRAGGAFQNPNGPMHWRQDISLSGLNVMALGIWYEAAMRWVGEATRVTAMAMTSVPMRANSEGAMQGVVVPDHIDVIADLAIGAQAHFQVSGITGHSGGSEAFIFGSDGTIRFADGKISVGGRNDEGLTPMEIPPGERAGWRVEDEFVGAIRGSEPIRRTTFADGVKYMEFTEAVFRSRTDGITVSLPLAGA